MDLPGGAVTVMELGGLRPGGPGEFTLRFHHEERGDRWFAELDPAWLAPTDRDGVARFVDTCLGVLEEGAFDLEATFFDDGYVSGDVLVSRDLDSSGPVFLAVDLVVDFRQDLVGHDANGRPLYRSARTVAFAPGCRFESNQPRTHLLGTVRTLRDRLAR